MNLEDAFEENIVDQYKHELYSEEGKAVLNTIKDSNEGCFPSYITGIAAHINLHKPEVSYLVQQFYKFGSIKPTEEIKGRIIWETTSQGDKDYENINQIRSMINNYSLDEVDSDE